MRFIGIVMSGVFLVGGAVASGFKLKEDARDYTDAQVLELRQEQTAATKELSEDIADMKRDTAVIRTIIEERFSRPHPRPTTRRGEDE